MSIKEFFGKAAAGIYVSGLSVIALVVALIGYIMYGTEKNNLEAVIIVFTVIAVVAGLMEMILTLAKGYRPMWDNMTIVYAILEAVATAIIPTKIGDEHGDDKNANKTPIINGYKNKLVFSV